jgi:hypothetical protein
MLTEIIQIVMHDVRRVIKYFWKDYRFMSNEELVLMLTPKVNQDPFDEAMEAYHHVKIPSLMEIRCPSGPKLRIRDVHNILHAFNLKESFIKAKHPHSMDLFLDPLLRNLMKRFGNMDAPVESQTLWQEKTAAFQRRMELETMRRAALLELRMHGEDLPDPDAGHGPAETATAGEAKAGHVTYCTLSVVIHAMRNLPSMDVFRGCDACCRIFFEGSPGLFQTEVRRGVRDEDWTWDPALSDGFCWDLPMDPEHLLPERRLVVLVFD